jgi:4,5:9,10-diseco-3-hydroxy-5,9,17-trioxoandrosta-1(10),2-diene-4-oate hydrolase
VDFHDAHVEADGFNIRFAEAGGGEPLVCFHGGGGLRVSYAHEFFAERYRVIAFEFPGFGTSAVNERSATMPDLARTMGEAIDALGIESYYLWGTSFGAKTALWLAAQRPEPIKALVLASPAAIRPDDWTPPPPEQMPKLMFVHPERQRPAEPPTPEIAQQNGALVRRLLGPPRDAELEDKLRSLDIPTLVVFGTEDKITPPDLGRLYVELMPDCYFVMLYDAAHGVDGDRPEAFSALVSDFLEHGDQFVVIRKSGVRYP